MEGLTGHEMCFDDADKQLFYNALKNYEDLEESGRLLRLPVTLGSTVYTLNPLENGKIMIAETTADAFLCALCMLEGRFGKTVFPSYEEAVEALKTQTTEKL